MISICCVGFASLDVVCDELNNCYCNVGCCCCLPTPLTLVCGGGGFDHPAFGPPASISLHLASSSITPAWSIHKSRGDSVVRMLVQLKRWCVLCVWVLQRGYSGDGCDLTSTLCKYDVRK